MEKHNNHIAKANISLPSGNSAALELYSVFNIVGGQGAQSFALPYHPSLSPAFQHDNLKVLSRLTSSNLAEAERFGGVPYNGAWKVQVVPYLALDEKRQAIHPKSRATLYKDRIITTLDSTTSLSRQEERYQFATMHEAGHRVFCDHYATTTPDDKLRAFNHNKEYMADAFASLVMGRSSAVAGFRAAVRGGLDETRETPDHPSILKRVHALQEAVYEAAVKQRLSEIKKPDAKGLRPGGWLDFVMKCNDYEKLQSSIDSNYKIR